MVLLGEYLATAALPEGYRYLNPQETNKILVDSWGNPPTTTLGMIVPAGVNPYSFEGWGVVITYEEDGHIEDEDASDIDFEDLLETMQEDVQDENEIRVREGYEPYQLGGWAEQPHYDPATHKLYWALELQFGHEDEAVSTLNYNVRILGREGVLVLNAVAGMEQFTEVREHMTDIQNFTSFAEGNKYSDYDPSFDRAATYGIGALVAGKMAAKTGFFKIAMAFFAKGWKFILLALAAAGAFIRRALTGGGKEKKDALS
nr:DUF2167 domain-containing protein [Fulvivirga sedimenti]